MIPSSLSAPTVDALLHCNGVGSDAWWREVTAIGTPLVTSIEGSKNVVVTFLWRDVHGCEARSPCQKVWINITGLTDHHAGCRPVSLTRIAGTDVWFYQLVMDATWRGSYCFVPSHTAHDVPSAPHTLQSLQQWWRRQLPQAMYDPLNKRPAWLSARGHPSSGMVMPMAAYSMAWQQWDHGPHPLPVPERLQRHVWYSQRLKTYRKIWVFETGDVTDTHRPLALLLDGQFWAQRMSIWSPIAHDTRTKRLPAAVYVLIDTLDNTHRKRDMVCSGSFWQAVQEELLPQVSQWAVWDTSPERTVVAGQSLSGIAALYAGVLWPHRFGNVISQSGAYWCLTEMQWQVFASSTTALNVFLQSGTHEPRIDEGHQRLLTTLRTSPHSVMHRIEPGGHDVMWWREGLLEGLHHVWRDREINASAENE